LFETDNGIDSKKGRRKAWVDFLEKKNAKSKILLQRFQNCTDGEKETSDLALVMQRLYSQLSSHINNGATRISGDEYILPIPITLTEQQVCMLRAVTRDGLGWTHIRFFPLDTSNKSDNE
jgi:hypothetical protein